MSASPAILLAAPVAALPRVAPAASPDILPRFVRQYSVNLGSPGPGMIAEQVQAIPCPPDMDAATVSRRLQFQAGRFCAVTALRRLDRHDRRVMPPSRGASGAPVWPHGVTGSITHTGGFVSAAVASCRDARSIGIDTEPIIGPERARSVSSAVAWACEVAQARKAGYDRLEALTIVFSAKESIFKCLHPLVGHRFDFYDVRIEAVGSTMFAARTIKTLSPDFPAGTILTGGFTVAAGVVHTGVLLPAREVSTTRAGSGDRP